MAQMSPPYLVRGDMLFNELDHCASVVSGDLDGPGDFDSIH
jgi:hypothetical protein